MENIYENFLWHKFFFEIILYFFVLNVTFFQKIFLIYGKLTKIDVFSKSVFDLAPFLPGQTSISKFEKKSYLFLKKTDKKKIYSKC